MILPLRTGRLWTPSAWGSHPLGDRVNHANPLLCGTVACPQIVVNGLSSRAFSFHLMVILEIVRDTNCRADLAQKLRVFQPTVIGLVERKIVKPEY